MDTNFVKEFIPFDDWPLLIKGIVNNKKKQIFSLTYHFFYGVHGVPFDPFLYSAFVVEIIFFSAVLRLLYNDPASFFNPPQANALAFAADKLGYIDFRRSWCCHQQLLPRFKSDDSAYLTAC